MPSRSSTVAACCLSDNETYYTTPRNWAPGSRGMGIAAAAVGVRGAAGPAAAAGSGSRRTSNQLLAARPRKNLWHQTPVSQGSGPYNCLADALISPPGRRGLAQPYAVWQYFWIETR